MRSSLLRRPRGRARSAALFEPPRCPYPRCRAHHEPRPGFWARHGRYHPRCRPRPVPRFRCRLCRRTFSRQTFRADYRDHKPHLNAPLVQLLVAGVGLRQSARMLPLSRRCTELKFRKLARHAARLDTNLRRPLPVDRLRLHLDEFETFETRRGARPLSMAVAIESRTRFLLAARAAPIRPRGRASAARRRAVEEDQRRFGVRPDRSRAVTRWALARAAALAPAARRVVLATDEKSTYPSLAARVFGSRRLEHRRTPSVLPRDTRNPLFPINHTEACLRDLVGRLRRDSWLVSKRRCFLNLHLGLYAAWRNWVRPRFNRDRASPAQLLGLVGRPLRPAELLGWRQDWGPRSPHPLGAGRVPVASASGAG